MRRLQEADFRKVSVLYSTRCDLRGLVGLGSVTHLQQTPLNAPLRYEYRSPAQLKDTPLELKQLESLSILYGFLTVPGALAG